MTRPLLLRAAGVAVLVDTDGPQLPRVLHWGADPGPLDGDALVRLVADLTPAVGHAGLDEPWPFPLLPGEADGWSGRPGLAGHRDGRSPFAAPALMGPVDVTDDGGAQVLTAHGADPSAGVEVACELRLEPGGLLRVRHAVTNTGSGVYTLDGMLALLPVPGAAGELLDLTGRWCRERSPQRRPFAHGTLARESRRGRTGHDATLLLVAGTPGFGFRSGEVWAVHTGWSGDHVHLAERLPEGAGAGGSGVLGGGELLLPGEVRLAEGETYTTPWVSFTYGGSGLDEASARVHRWLRARPQPPASHAALDPQHVGGGVLRPVPRETDRARRAGRPHRRGAVRARRRLVRLAPRRHPRARRLVRRRRRLARRAPPARRPGARARHGVRAVVRARDGQPRLGRRPRAPRLGAGAGRAGLARASSSSTWRTPAAYAYLLERISALVDEVGIAYIKWDHNRDLHVAISTAGTTRGAAGVHAQTLAVYRLLDELRARHPGLEIESCSSGGARVDLGILERTDRVWASDCNDPIERQMIQRWTGLLLPPELVGAHVGPEIAHTTHRSTPLGLRTVTALFGHAGLEWDVTTCTPEEVDRTHGVGRAVPRGAEPAAHRGRRPRGPDRRRDPAARRGRAGRLGGALRLRAAGDVAGRRTGAAAAARARPRPHLRRRAPPRRGPRRRAGQLPRRVVGGRARPPPGRCSRGSGSPPRGSTRRRRSSCTCGLMCTARRNPPDGLCLPV